MELRVIDFEILTRNFKIYVDGYKDIESEKRKMIDSIQPSKKEIEDIIRRSQSGLIVDESTQRRDMDRYKALQDGLMAKDQEFKKSLKDMMDNLNTVVYDKLSEIINNWSVKNNIDIVMGKMEVIFNTDKLDATNDILDLIKELDLYYEQEEPSLIGESL